MSWMEEGSRYEFNGIWKQVDELDGIWKHVDELYGI